MFRRTPRLSTILWLSSKNNLRESFKKILSKKENAELYGEDFIYRLSENLEIFERRQLKLFVINGFLICALFLHIVFGEISVNFWGFPIKDIGKLKEIIIFASSTISFISIIINMSIVYLQLLQKVWIEHNYYTVITRFKLATVRSLFTTGQLIHNPSDEYVFKHKITKFFQYSFGILFISLMFFLLIGSMLIHFAIIIDAILNPSIPQPWSGVLVGYVVCVDLASILYFIVFYFPLPHVDYSLTMELANLRKKDEKAYEDRLRQIVVDFKKK